MSAFIRPPWQWPQSCFSVLITPPTEEPLTLEEAKLLAGLTWVSPDPRDDLITGFIAAARSQVEHDTGLALLTQTRDVTITPPLNGIVPLPPQAVPVQSIAEVTALTAGGTRLVLDPHRIPWDSSRSILSMTWDPAWSGVTLRIVAGWPTVTQLKAEVPLLVHAVGLLTAHKATLGRDLASTTPTAPVVMGYEEAIGPHRLVWVT